jgi:5-methylcytosine-specific restriction endonuclease McrA
VNIMASRAHRWKGDDTPLTGVHGGSAAAARAAVKESKRLLDERARAAVREVIARNQAAYESAPRKDRLRPRASSRPRSPRSWLTDLMLAQNGLCFYCGRRMLTGPLPDEALFRRATIDHYVPLARGGLNVRDNVVGACNECNNRKGALMPDEFAAIAMPLREERVSG